MTLPTHGEFGAVIEPRWMGAVVRVRLLRLGQPEQRRDHAGDRRGDHGARRSLYWKHCGSRFGRTERFA